MTRVRYKGRMRNGVASAGVIDVADLGVWVENKFRAGWRTLTAFTDDEQVGGIGPDPSDERRRTWWAS